MGKYSEEFKSEAVRLAQMRVKPINVIADDLGISSTTLRGWIAKIEPTAPSGETPAQELERLRKENRILQMERDILKKATAFFAKESRFG